MTSETQPMQLYRMQYLMTGNTFGSLEGKIWGEISPPPPKKYPKNTECMDSKKLPSIPFHYCCGPDTSFRCLQSEFTVLQVTESEWGPGNETGWGPGNEANIDWLFLCMYHFQIHMQ